MPPKSGEPPIRLVCKRVHLWARFQVLEDVSHILLPHFIILCHPPRWRPAEPPPSRWGSRLRLVHRSASSANPYNASSCRRTIELPLVGLSRRASRHVGFGLKHLRFFARPGLAQGGCGTPPILAPAISLTLLPGLGTPGWRSVWPLFRGRALVCDVPLLPARVAHPFVLLRTLTHPMVLAPAPCTRGSP